MYLTPLDIHHCYGDQLIEAAPGCTHLPVFGESLEDVRDDGRLAGQTKRLEEHAQCLVHALVFKRERSVHAPQNR